MNFKQSFSIFIILSALFAANAQTNSTTVTYASLLDGEEATCAMRDQINWFNQILAVEYVSRAYFSALNANLGNVNDTFLVASQVGGNVDYMKSNVTLIVNQLNEVISWLNTTVNNMCSQLPSGSDASDECYSYVSCNYTFGNLTGWPATVGGTNHTNITGNATTGNTSFPTNSSASSSSNITTYTVRALRQGVDFSDTEAQYLITMVPLISNSTLQQQLSLFAVMHGQHAAYLRGVSTHATEFAAPVIVSSSSFLQRASIRTDLLPYIADQSCCDGFRGLRK